jgi:methyl-accepting chemotaxis protein/methyl-accepting chemotaxis protein-1 (serine sensor receptor)
MKRNLTLQQKLLGSSSILAVVALVGALTSAWMINTLNASVDHAVNGTARTMDALSKFVKPLDSLRTLSRGAVVYAFLQKPEIVDQQITKIMAGESETREALARVQGLLKTPDERAAFEQVAGILDQWLTITNQTMDMCRAGKPEEAANNSQKSLREFAAVFDKAQTDLLEVERRDLQASATQSAVLHGWSRWLAGLSIVLTLAATAIAFFFTRRVSGQLRQAIHKIAAGAGKVHSAASQIASASQSLAGAASELAAGIEETSASAQEMAGVSGHSSEQSSEASSLVSDVGVALRDGNRSVNAMVASMDEIGASNNKVSKIIRVIDEIAFQTNILALNAAVEAARAGEAGLGFAVVADEVRTLAQRSAQAAKDTEVLIEETLSKSKTGRECVDQVAVVFHQISSKSETLGTLIGAVRTGNEQQAQGLAQISRAVSQMSQGTQTAAASAEESAASSSEMTAQAGSLREISTLLKKTVG